MTGIAEQQFAVFCEGKGACRFVKQGLVDLLFKFVHFLADCALATVDLLGGTGVAAGFYDGDKASEGVDIHKGVRCFFYRVKKIRFMKNWDLLKIVVYKNWQS